MQKTLIDTGYWIALFNERDSNYKHAVKHLEYLELTTPVIPWPTMYEYLRTKWVKKIDPVTKLNDLLKRMPHTEFIEDSKYFEIALETVLQAPYRRISLADEVMRMILSNENERIDYFMTYNEIDFTDVCQIRRIGIL